MKNPDIFVLSLICSLKLSQKPQHRDKCKFNCVWRYISSVFCLCYPNRFIRICIYLKLNEETNLLGRNFVLERPKLVPRPARSYEEMPCCFYIRSRKGVDFLIVLQG